MHAQYSCRRVHFYAAVCHKSEKLPFQSIRKMLSTVVYRVSRGGASAEVVILREESNCKTENYSFSREVLFLGKNDVRCAPSMVLLDVDLFYCG